MSVRAKPSPAETTAQIQSASTTGSAPPVDHDGPTIIDPAGSGAGPTPSERSVAVEIAPTPVPPLLARLIGGFGRGLIMVGVLLLLFACFQLWGTGVAEQRAQADLERRFEAQLAELTVPPPSERAVLEVPAIETDQANEMDGTGATATSDQATEADVEPVPEFQPDVGDPVGMIDIPAIGISKTIVEGTTRDALREGPGHYRSTPLPGRSGNTAIAGHRTTHGAPFFDIDQLVPGDEISVRTVEGVAVYRVEAHGDGAGGEIGHLIVDPSEVGVIADKGDNRLTLTACHPKYSAAERIIVTATMVSGPALDAADEPASSPTATTTETPAQDGLGPDEPEALGAADRAHRQRAAHQAAAGSAGGDEIGFGENTDGADTVAASLGWQPTFTLATATWAAVTALIAVVASVAGRLWRRFPAYAMAVPPLTLALFHCFTNLEKLLPAV